MKTLLSRSIASWAVSKQKQWAEKPIVTQQTIFNKLIQQAKGTRFGQDHHFNNIRTYKDFKNNVPIRDYEGLASYIDKAKAGKEDILWPGKPMYWAKTSGTTSGSKYIPITKASLPHHITSARNALLSYIHEIGNTDFLKGNMIFLSGSPQLDDTLGVPTGRLSGIVNHHVPFYLRYSQQPSYTINCIEDWERKLDAIVEETVQAKMTLISGVPPWVQMYFDKLKQRTTRQIKDIFPDFSLLVHGGVNFTPYRTKLFETIGKPVDTIETYPASEGFIAFQDSQYAEGLLLQLNSDIFFEFIPASQYATKNFSRLWLEEVELGVEYALILSNNAGLWAYSLGDTIKFVSKDPYRIVVTGRVNHFTSAFGEHVIAEEVDKAMRYALGRHPEVVLTEFTVAPHVSQQAGEASYHEWLIEFERPPQDIKRFSYDLEQELRRLNAYYDDLIKGKTLQQLQITRLNKGAFQEYMRLQGKLGGQNKVVRLANDRSVANDLLGYRSSKVAGP